MNEDHIRRFNEARTFLYLAGYVTDTENENIKLSGDALEVKYARQSTENHCY
jgi:hypothetical protein